MLAIFNLYALHRLLEIPLSGCQEEAAGVGIIRERTSWRIIERRNICEPLFLVHKEPTVIDWRLYVPCYIFISILIINIENEKYKYSSFKETWADLIYNEHSSDPSTVVKAHCMAGILTRDTINQPVLSYKCLQCLQSLSNQEDWLGVRLEGENDSMIFIPRISRFGCKAGTSMNHEAWTRQQMGKICRFEASAKCSIIDSMELEE